MFQNQKNCFVPDVTQAVEIQKSTSTELHEWSENMVNVENCPVLKENSELLSAIQSEMKIVIMFCNSSLLQHSLHFASTIFCSGDI